MDDSCQRDAVRMVTVRVPRRMEIQGDVDVWAKEDNISYFYLCAACAEWAEKK
jgi:hypothetical protein